MSDHVLKDPDLLTSVFLFVGATSWRTVCNVCPKWRQVFKIACPISYECFMHCEEQFQFAWHSGYRSLFEIGMYAKHNMLQWSINFQLTDVHAGVAEIAQGLAATGRVETMMWLQCDNKFSIDTDTRLSCLELSIRQIQSSLKYLKY
jgi:hypothetical protein